MIDWILISLIGLVIFQQIYFLYQIHKLVDKIMSRSFLEYRAAQAPNPEPKKQEFENIDLSLQEDLRVLNGIMG